METLVSVQVGNSITDPITVNSGLRQGNFLSSILFKVVLEKVIREMKIELHEDTRLQDTLISLLGYADDIVLMEGFQDMLKILFSRLYKAASKVGLYVNEERMEYMFLSRWGLPFCQFIKIDHYEFKYLGTILTEKIM
ncbi:Reverse transcriptase domain [Cinara cedri]|uniref:Reverse transcriptase domain n=1 Tax=Cinara cedri TaxID=506608 RepID=A0A5E4MFS3_9HEMI|nr:Reverse transcriptase domain [Cinara cedri]